MASSTPWLHELIDEVRVALVGLEDNRHDCRPALESERQAIEASIEGWSQSLADRNLPPVTRTRIYADWIKAGERLDEIIAQSVEESARLQSAQLVLRPEEVTERLARLGSVLAANNPTLANLELSLHIDRIECFPDGRVNMRTCKLGAMNEVVEALSAESSAADGVVAPTFDGPRARRRGRLRVNGETETDEDDLDDLVQFATDTNRFAGLGDEWFWIDEFTQPGRRPSWPEANAERVFRRRQQSGLPYSKLAEEESVTGPTIGAAMKHYIETHPGARDEVHLRRGGRRKPKFNLAAFAEEARALYEAGWPKEKLATKFECSPPTIVKALDLAYQSKGSRLPSRADRRAAKAAEARRLFDERPSLVYIAAAMNVSDTTARKYLAESFRAEGEPMPDLRSLRGNVVRGSSRVNLEGEGGNERPPLSD